MTTSCHSITFHITATKIVIILLLMQSIIKIWSGMTNIVIIIGYIAIDKYSYSER